MWLMVKASHFCDDTNCAVDLSTDHGGEYSVSMSPLPNRNISWKTVTVTGTGWDANGDFRIPGQYFCGCKCNAALFK